MKNLYSIKIENFFLLKRELFSLNFCRFMSIFVTLFLLINYYSDLYSIYTFNYYILFNIGIILYALYFLPKQLIHELIISCFYRILNINILIYITFFIMIIFNYYSFTIPELFFFSKFVWTSTLSCFFIKNLIYMKINKQNLIYLFTMLSFLSIFSYINLLVLLGFISIIIDMDSYILKINGESSGQNNINQGSNFNNNSPNPPEPNTNYLASYSHDNSKDKSEDNVGMIISKKAHLDLKKLNNEKDFLYREEYYKKFDVLSNKEINPKPYKHIYIKNLSNIFTKVPKDLAVHMFNLKVERDSLSLDAQIALEDHKSIFKSESKLNNDNLEGFKELQKTKEASWSKYSKLNEELIQKDKHLRSWFKACNIPEYTVSSEKF